MSNEYATHFSDEEGGLWQEVKRNEKYLASDAYFAAIHPAKPYIAYRFESGRVWDTINGWRDGNCGQPNIFTQASDIIYGDREKTYGHPAKNLEHIADQWSLFLRQKYGINLKLTPEDVCWMMADLKKARQMNENKHDNVLDAIGYIGLVSRIAEPRPE